VVRSGNQKNFSGERGSEAVRPSHAFVLSEMESKALIWKGEGFRSFCRIFSGKEKIPWVRKSDASKVLLVPERGRQKGGGRSSPPPSFVRFRGRKPILREGEKMDFEKKGNCL